MVTVLAVGGIWLPAGRGGCQATHASTRMPVWPSPALATSTSSSLVTRAPSGASVEAAVPGGRPEVRVAQGEPGLQVRLLPGQQRLRTARCLPEVGHVHLPGGPEVAGRALEYAAGQVRRSGQAVTARRHRERPQDGGGVRLGPLLERLPRRNRRVIRGQPRRTRPRRSSASGRGRRPPGRAGRERDRHADGREGDAGAFPVISCPLDSCGDGMVPPAPHARLGGQKTTTVPAERSAGYVSSLGCCAEFFRWAARGPRLA